MKRQSRRQVLAQVGGAGVLGASGAWAIQATAAGASAKGGARAVKTGVVERVSGATVTIAGDRRSYTAEGFPENWDVAVGDTVMVARSLTHPDGRRTVQPVVRWATAVAAPGNLSSGAVVKADGETARITPATVFTEEVRHRRDANDRVARSLLVCVVDRAGASGNLRAIAVREA